MTKFAIIREEKKPVDLRVALSPQQASSIGPNNIIIQSSEDRIFKNQEYKNEGLLVKNSIEDADIYFGVKEVPKDKLIAHKTYLFFSHTIKEQSYNQGLFKEILNKKIRLIDYETLTNDKGQRILGFGRWAGIVGAYNAFLTYGKKTKLFDLNPAHNLKTYPNLIKELSNIKLDNIKICLTGRGRVGSGALEILDALKMKKVNTHDFINKKFEYPVYCHLNNEDIYAKKDGGEFINAHFYENHQEYKSIFEPYTHCSDILINGIYWEDDLERLFQKESTAKKNFSIKVIADISCDVEGSVPITLRATPIEDPVIGWDGILQKECAPYSEKSIDVMAVTNLPCELAASASEDFGSMLLAHVIPELIKDESELIDRATLTTLEGKLGKNYQYLKEYAGI